LPHSIIGARPIPKESCGSRGVAKASCEARDAHLSRRGGKTRAAPRRSDEIAIGMSRRIWKEGATNASARLTTSPEGSQMSTRAPIRPERPEGKARQDSAYGLKGRLMRFQVMRSGAAALALSVALGAGAAVAQTPPAKPAAPAPGAAPAPSPTPGAPGQPPQPAPPSKVDLVSPEPQWAKFCAKEPTTGKDACATMRDFSTSADQPPMISVNVFELAGEEKRKLRLLMLPIGMLLRPGFRVIIDKGEPIDGKYDMCFQNACSAEIEISPKTLETIKKGQTMSVVMRVPGGDASGRELTFNLPLKDFAPAFDGKPTDPKVLEQQRQELQQQLQKKAEEQRKMLEQQQQNGSAAPAANAAPAAPAVPAAPAAPAAPAK
jgi:invasion protein IalB